MSYQMPQDLQNKIDTLKQEMKATQGRGTAIQARADREHRELTSTEQADLDRLFLRFD